MPGAGIEPAQIISLQDFKSCASTDFATRATQVVTRRGFEPLTPWLKVKCSTDGASESVVFGWGKWTRTTAWQSQSLLPYQLGYTPKKWWARVDSNHRRFPSRFTVCRIWPLCYLPISWKWWMRRGSNSRPPPCKGDALPAELSIPIIPSQIIISRVNIICNNFFNISAYMARNKQHDCNDQSNDVAVRYFIYLFSGLPKSLNMFFL